MMRRKPESRSPAEAACGMRVRNGRTDVEQKAGAGDSQTRDAHRPDWLSPEDERNLAVFGCLLLDGRCQQVSPINEQESCCGNTQLHDSVYLTNSRMSELFQGCFDKLEKKKLLKEKKE